MGTEGCPLVDQFGGTTALAIAKIKSAEVFILSGPILYRAPYADVWRYFEWRSSGRPDNKAMLVFAQHYGRCAN